MSKSRSIRCFYYNLLVILLVDLLFIESSFGFLNLGISGSSSLDTYGYKKNKSNTISINGSLGIGSHFQLGVSHAIKDELLDGYDKGYGRNLSEAKTTKTTSLDITIIPIIALVSPFVFGGAANKKIIVTYRLEGKDPVNFKPLPQVLPTYGFGFKVFLNKSFDLKLTRRFTPGAQLVHVPGIEDPLQKYTVDVMTQIGFIYKM